jgi:hypothetical protein
MVYPWMVLLAWKQRLHQLQRIQQGMSKKQRLRAVAFFIGSLRHKKPLRLQASQGESHTADAPPGNRPIRRA